MSTPANNLSTLLGNASYDDDLTNAMLLTLDDLGDHIAAGLGDVTLDDVEESEVVLVTQLVDDSYSITSADNQENVRFGHNLVISSLRGSKQSAAVLTSCRYLNEGPSTDHGVLYPYKPLDGVAPLDEDNYIPIGGTPLYDQVAVTLTGVAAKAAEFEDGNVPVRAVTIIVSDGADQHSRKHDARSVRRIVDGLLKTEQHIVMAIGISDAPAECYSCRNDLRQNAPKKGRCPKCNDVVGTDFEQVFGDMGIRPQWILTPANSESELRAAFAVASQSAVRASQAAGSFSQVALGGFGS